MERIIIVTGTPGVGKTLLSRQLARQTRSELLNLGTIVRREKLYSRFDRSAKSYIIDERRLRNWLDEFFKARLGGGLVVETHWLGRFMPKRSRMVAVVVRLDPTVLASRLRARKWPKAKIRENVEAEMIDLSLYESIRFLGARRVYEINATGKRSRLLVQEAMKLLSAGRGWDGSTPNWLARYDPVELSRRIA